MQPRHGKPSDRSVPSKTEEAQAAQLLCRALMEANLDEFHYVVAEALAAYEDGHIDSDAVAGYVAHSYISMILCNERLQRSSRAL